VDSFQGTSVNLSFVVHCRREEKLIVEEKVRRKVIGELGNMLFPKRTSLLRVGWSIAAEFLFYDQL
jgi:hypothetical protein